jgi:hypothetical protein
MGDSVQAVPLDALKELCNPFDGICWRGLEKPVTRQEIAAALASNTLLAPDGSSTLTLDRAGHIARIAWFVVHGWTDHIEIDVGVPSMGCYVQWPVEDGNHRYAAAIYRDDATIAAEISGSLNYAEEIGLF